MSGIILSANKEGQKMNTTIKGVGGLLLLFASVTTALSAGLKIPPQISTVVAGATTLGVWLLTSN